MQLYLIENLGVIKAVMSDGQELEFPCKIWNRQGVRDRVRYREEDEEPVQADIFNCINRYMADMPEGQAQALEHIYFQAHDILETSVNVLEVNQTLSVLIEQLMDLFPWEPFSEWCRLYGGLNLSIGRKDELGENDYIDMTYFTEDYENLVFFTVLLKAIIPIWGLYYSNMVDLLGRDHTIMYAVDLINNRYTEHNPALIKLEQHATAFVNKNIGVKKKGYSLMNNIGSEEIPEYLLAFTIWNKVCVFDARTTDRSVIKNIHRVLTDMCDKIKIGGPKEKKLVNESGQEMSITDICKVIQRVPPAVSTTVTFNVNMDSFVNVLGKGVTAKDVEEILNNMPVTLPVQQFHYTILGMLYREITGCRNTLLLQNKPLFRMLAVGSATLRQYGYPTIADLLVSVPKPRDIYSTSITASKSQLAIPVELTAALDDMYRFIGANPNPGIETIGRIVKEVNMWVWPIATLEQLSIELAKLLLTRGDLNHEHSSK